MDTSNQDLDTSEIIAETDVKNLWKEFDDNNIYQHHATIFSIDSTTEPDETSILEKINIIDLEKRKEVYGICGECNEPGTGFCWCQPCNGKRFKENFKSWTSENKIIDELIQKSQLNALCSMKCLEWIPYEKFESITYISKGGFSKIYSADWSEGNIKCWDIEKQEWEREPNIKVALKSLNNSSNISDNFLNEINYYISGHFHSIYTIICYGITKDPDSEDYMMVLPYCDGGNLRNILMNNIDYTDKIDYLLFIINGLSIIHDAGKVHKDFHSGNILVFEELPIISDLGMCQPVNNEDQSTEKGVYGVIPYMAPEVLRGCEYTKAADIYSFGIVMNELLSEEIPYNDIPHDYNLAIKICEGFRPKISEYTPKLIADLIIKCWDAKAENRPTTKEICQILKKYMYEINDENGEIYSQIKECEKIKLKSRNNHENRTNNHPQAIYTSRLLNFENLPEPVNSIGSFQEPVLLTSAPVSSTSANLTSECLDCELDELDLNQDDDEFLSLLFQNL